MQFSHDLEERCKRKEHGWCQYGKKCFRQYETEYQAQNEAVKWKVEIDKDINNRGPVYNIDCDRKPPHMIDNQLRQDTRINENRNRKLKE